MFKRIIASALAVSIINVCTMTAVAANDKARFKAQEQGHAWLVYVSGERFHRLVEGAVSQENLKLTREISGEDEPPNGTQTKRWNTLEKLLEAHIITKTEYDALKAAMAAPSVRAEGLGAAKRGNPFARFADEGIISAETSQNIMEYLMACRRSDVSRTILGKSTAYQDAC